MNKSETIGKLAEALAKAQAEMKNPHFDAVNPHFRSKFASLAAVRDAVIPVFSKHGLSVSQWPIGADGHAGCKTILAHSSGEYLHESFIIPVDKQNAHGYASAVTYTKRISLQSIAAVVGDEDDDANGAVATPKARDQNDLAKTIVAANVKPNADAGNDLDAAQKRKCDELANEIIDSYKAGYLDAGVDAIDEANLDMAEKLYLWTKLDSAIRSGIKKIQKARREEALKAEEATQA
jgi:hypothetical protein